MPFLIVRLENGQTEKLNYAYGLSVTGHDDRKYVLSKFVKGGGNGAVFEATCYAPDGTDEGICAVKLLKALSDVRQDRFSNEIRILKELGHQKITKCFGHGTVQLGEQKIDVPWMAMSLGGDNLRQFLDDTKHALDVPTTLKVCIQICDALSHVHDKEIIHRDLKPANLVWTTDEDRENIFLLDFGIAKFVGEDVSGRKMDTFTSMNEFVGPANFSSPELLAYARDKSHSVDHRSDLFQVGLLLWFLATNQVLAGVPSKKRDPSGGAIHELVMDLVAEDPDDRLQSAQEVKERLEKLQ